MNIALLRKFTEGITSCFLQMLIFIFIPKATYIVASNFLTITSSPYKRKILSPHIMKRRKPDRYLKKQRCYTISKNVKQIVLATSCKNFSFACLEN